MHKREDFFNLVTIHKYPKQVYVDLFYILTSEGYTNYTSNSNGIFFNMQNLSDELVNKATEYISNIYNNAESYNKTIKDRQEQMASVHDNLSHIRKPALKTPPVKKNICPELIKDPFTNIKYTGVYERMDNILKGRVTVPVPDKKQKLPDNVSDDDEDLFGDEDEENTGVEVDVEVEVDDEEDEEED